jgi:hypothetical protein
LIEERQRIPGSVRIRSADGEQRLSKILKLAAAFAVVLEPAGKYLAGAFAAFVH